MLQALFSAFWARKVPSLDLLREKRRTTRYPSRHSLVVLARDRPFLARYLDESAGGVRFECSGHAVIRRGDRVELSPTEIGRVAWVKRVSGRQQVGVEREDAPIPEGERREYVRLAVPVGALCRGQRVEVLDLSLRGIRIRGEEPVLCTELVLELDLPGSPLTVRARVQENLGCVARLSLSEMDPASERRLAEFLVSQLPH